MVLLPLSLVSLTFRRCSCSAVGQLSRAMAASLVRKPLPVDSVPYQKFLQIRDTPEVQLLSSIFSSAGFELRIAGGAVRDLLTGVTPHDIDFATTASPEEMIQILSPHESQVRIITTKAGTRHGSITARISDKSQFEVTTLRIDKKTDGRHAEVEFVRDWAIDASRRDLTINAMFLDFEGNVIDYFNGREDLERKLIRFVGDPGERVREDYLRIFRYFRFYVRYGCLTQHEDQTIEAIRSNSNGLNQISGERIWAELKRLLKLKDAPSVMHLMLNDLRIGMYMGFKSHPIDVKEYERVHEALFNETPVPLFEPVTALTALMRNEDDLNECAKRLKFSNNERFACVYILANRDERNRVNLKSLQKQLALIPPTEQQIFRKYVLEFLRYINRYELLKEMRDWPVPKFTIDTDLLKERMKNRSGREYGIVMKSLRSAWADGDFSLSEETAKQIIDDVLQS